MVPTADLVELLFRPGFSMDAVRAAAEEHGGQVTMRSEAGVGSVLVAEVPLEVKG